MIHFEPNLDKFSTLHFSHVSHGGFIQRKVRLAFSTKVQNRVFYDVECKVNIGVRFIVEYKIKEENGLFE